MRRLGLPVAQFAFLVVLVLLWQWASSAGVLDPFFVGLPSTIVGQLGEWAADGTMVAGLLATGSLLVLGFVLGLVAGMALGTLMAFSRLAGDVLEPFVVFLNAVPRIVLYPFLLVWLGFGLAPKIIIIMLVMAPAVAISVVAGFREVEGTYLDNLRAQGARWPDLARHVYAPSLTLWLFSTSRVNFAFAFQAVLVAELIGSNNGLGHLIVEGQGAFAINQILSALVLVVVLAIVLDGLLQAAERRATRWMPARR